MKRTKLLKPGDRKDRFKLVRRIQGTILQVFPVQMSSHLTMTGRHEFSSHMQTNGRTNKQATNPWPIRWTYKLNRHSTTQLRWQEETTASNDPLRFCIPVMSAIGWLVVSMPCWHVAPVGGYLEQAWSWTPSCFLCTMISHFAPTPLVLITAR